MWEQLFTHRINGTKFEVKHYSWNLSRLPLQGRMTTAIYSDSCFITYNIVFLLKNLLVL